jgi:hypothetical protein
LEPCFRVVAYSGVRLLLFVPLHQIVKRVTARRNLLVQSLALWSARQSVGGFLRGVDGFLSVDACCSGFPKLFPQFLNGLLNRGELGLQVLVRILEDRDRLLFLLWLRRWLANCLDHAAEFRDFTPEGFSFTLRFLTLLALCLHRAYRNSIAVAGGLLWGVGLRFHNGGYRLRWRVCLLAGETSAVVALLR